MGVLGGSGGLGGGNSGSASGPAGGDLAGTYPDPTVAKIQTTPVSSGAPTAGDVLTFTAGQWVPAAPTGGAPTGAASGDLSGTYPSPTVAKIQTTPVSAVVPTAGQMLRESGGTWTPTTVTATTVGADPSGTASSAIADHVAELNPHPQYAPLESPEFTGEPLTPTPFPTDDASQKIPNTEWVGNRIGLALGAYQPDLAQAAGILPIANGGTGIAAPGSSGNVPRSNGAGAWVAAALGVADVTGALAASGGTLTGGTIAGSTSISGTATAAGGSTIALAGASSVTVPTVAFPDSDNSAASTGFVAESRNLAKVSTESDDFTSGGQAGRLGWVATINGTLASLVANPALTADGDGVITLSTGTNASGRAVLSREVTAGLLPYSRPWLAGTFRKDWRVLFPVLPTATNDFRTSIALGVGATVSGDDFVSGIGIRYDSILAQWVLVSRNAAADIGTPQNTGIAPTAATWQYIYFAMDGTSARVFIGATKAAATLRATVLVADLTFVGAIGPIIKVRNTAGVLSRSVVVDLYEQEYIRTTAR